MIEQAAQEAKEREEQQKAKLMAALAAQGGYSSACNMLSSKFGEEQTNMMVNQLVQTLQDKITKARETCMKNGNCGSTQVDITIDGNTAFTNTECSEQPNSPCNTGENPDEQPKLNEPEKTEITNPNQPEPNDNSFLGNINARLESWSTNSRYILINIYMYSKIFG